MRKFVALFIMVSFAAAFLGACGSGNCGSSGGTTVHMCGNHFGQSSVTIKKGQSLTLTDDDSMEHIIANGSWVNGSAAPKQEPGAPVVNNLQFNGNDSHSIGPFSTPGTFHYYCIIHQGMNLTVIVQ